MRGLLCFQASERIGHRTFHRLYTHRTQGYQHSQRAGQGEHPPAEGNAVGEGLQPLIHAPPRNRSGNNKRDGHQFQEVL